MARRWETESPGRAATSPRCPTPVRSRFAHPGVVTSGLAPTRRHRRGGTGAARGGGLQPAARSGGVARAGGRRAAPLHPVGPSAASRDGRALVGPSAEADPVTRRPHISTVPRTLAGRDARNAGDRHGTAGASDEIPEHESSCRIARSSNGKASPGPTSRAGAGRFERVRVSTDHPARGGWGRAALAAGDTVVVRGAEELLSEEFRARVTVGDESGE